MQSLNSNVKIAILDRVRWATKTNEVKEHLEKLEMQKSSLTLILTILTWYVSPPLSWGMLMTHSESSFEANSAVGRLEYLVTQVIERHEVMAQYFSFPSSAPVVANHTTPSIVHHHLTSLEKRLFIQATMSKIWMRQECTRETDPFKVILLQLVL